MSRREVIWLSLLVVLAAGLLWEPTRMVRLLLKHGADSQAINYGDATPMDNFLYEPRRTEKDIVVIRQLIEQRDGTLKADPSRVDDDDDDDVEHEHGDEHGDEHEYEYEYEYDDDDEQEHEHGDGGGHG